MSTQYFKKAIILLCTLFSVAPFTAPSMAAELSIKDIPGGNQYKGKVVLLDFWASWCSPCVRSFPWMKEMSAKYAKDGLMILTVNVDAERADAEKFIKEQASRLPVIFDAQGEYAQKFGVLAMPSSFLFGRDGRLFVRHNGFLEKDRAQYESDIQNALKKK